MNLHKMCFFKSIKCLQKYIYLMGCMRELDEQKGLQSIKICGGNQFMINYI